MEIATILNESKTIAMIGVSRNPERTSNQIARYLIRKGFKILPVNPNYEEVEGEHCVRQLTDLCTLTSVDIVNIFRKAEESANAVKQAAEWKDMTGQTPVVWTQLGVSSDKAEQIAKNAGLPYVKNRCIKVEYERI